MLVPDVNVYIHAFRFGSPEHDRYRRWLTERLEGPEPLGVSELVLSGFLRIITNHRVFPEQSGLAKAMEFCATVLGAPAAVAVRPGPEHWSIFADLCRRVHATANVVPDAYHAALAIENGATWVTNDRGFARFPGLRWVTLDDLDEPG